MKHQKDVVTSNHGEKFTGTTLTISWSAIKNNILYFKKKLKPTTKIMVMVKASAYGNGAVHLSKRIEKENLADYLSVAYLQEGIELRKAGIKSPIMVLNPNIHQWAKLIEHCLEPEIHSLVAFQAFNNFLFQQGLKNSNYPIHLKLNSGMNRLGINGNEIPTLINYLKGNCQLKVSSIMSHLSASGIPSEDSFTKGQIKLFNQLREQLSPYLDEDCLSHILNSNGIERHLYAQMDMVRLGIGMYGGSDVPSLKKAAHPIAQLSTEICAIRKVKKGASISYSRSGRAANDCYIATLSIGYADGFNRNLSNGKWNVEIDGKLYPIIGDICMDLSIVDLGDQKKEIGTKVIIFGGLKSIHDFAEAQQTISYEAMTNMGERVKRIILD